MTEEELLESLAGIVIKRAWLEDGYLRMELGDTRIILIQGIGYDGWFDGVLIREETSE